MKSKQVRFWINHKLVIVWGPWVNTLIEGGVQTGVCLQTFGCQATLISCQRCRLHCCPPGSGRTLALGKGDVVYQGWDLDKTGEGPRVQN